MSIQCVGCGHVHQLPRYGGKGPNEAAQKILETNDVDGDGGISSEESGLPEDVFSIVDTNQDGSQSAEEVEEALARGNQWLRHSTKVSNEAARKILEINDIDGDGGISSDESGLSDDIFSKVDTDQDGSQSAEEIETALSRNRMARKQSFLAQAYTTPSEVSGDSTQDVVV